VKTSKNAAFVFFLFILSHGRFKMKKKGKTLKYAKPEKKVKITNRRVFPMASKNVSNKEEGKDS